jgi:hypothetical protein
MRRAATACGLALLAYALAYALAYVTSPARYFLPLLSRREILSAPAAILGSHQAFLGLDTGLYNRHLLKAPIARPRSDEFQAWEEIYDGKGTDRRVEFAKFGEEGVQVSVTANPSGLESVHPAWARDNSWHAVARARGQRLRGTSFRVADGLAFLDVVLEGRIGPQPVRESLTLMAHAGTLWTLSCAAETSRWATYCPQVVDSFRPGFDAWSRW